MNAVLTVDEYADLFRVHPMTVRRAIKRGEIPTVRVGGVTRIPRSALPAALTVPHTSALSTDFGGSAAVESVDNGAVLAVGEVGDAAPLSPTTEVPPCRLA